MNQKPNIAFFGTSEYAVMVIDALHKAGYTPKLVVTTPDKPKGRKLMLTPPPVKVWALEHNLPVLQPEKLKAEAFLSALKESGCDLYVVVAYGKIIPQVVLDIPKYGALNVHASLLPKLRGASPIESAILQDMKETGVTIMVVDAEMDHGPIVAQRNVTMPNWPPKAPELGKALVEAGAEALIESIPGWIQGMIKPIEQNHAEATFTRMIEKTDGLIDLSADPYQNFLKIQAYSVWPQAYFFVQHNGKNIRVVIKQAEFKDGKLEITRIVPEGKHEMSFKDFMKNITPLA